MAYYWCRSDTYRCHKLMDGYAPTPRLTKDGKGYPQYHNDLDKLRNSYGLSRGTLPLQIASQNDKYRDKKTNLFPYKY